MEYFKSTPDCKDYASVFEEEASGGRHCTPPHPRNPGQVLGDQAGPCNEDYAKGGTVEGSSG